MPTRLEARYSQTFRNAAADSAFSLAEGRNVACCPTQNARMHYKWQLLFLNSALVIVHEREICREKYRVSAQYLNIFGCRWEVLVPLDSSCDILHCQHIMYPQKTDHVIKGECQVVRIRPRGEKQPRFGNTQPSLRLLDLSITKLCWVNWPDNPK